MDIEDFDSLVCDGCMKPNLQVNEEGYCELFVIKTTCVNADEYKTIITNEAG